MQPPRVRPALTRALRATVLAVVSVLLAAGTTGCSGDDEKAPEPSPAATPLELHTRVTRIAGRLPASRRRAVEKHVGAAVRGYLEAAFVETSGGTSAFPGFTPGARKLAVDDAAVLTAGAANTRVARASAYVSVFADHRRARGATVRLVLRLLDGDSTKPTPMTGRLLLTPTKAGWRVFGYDVARGTPSGTGHRP